MFDKRIGFALQRINMACAIMVADTENDLTMRQMAILCKLCLEHGPHTVRALAEALNIAKPPVSRAINALVERGFAYRIEDETDRRSVIIKPTETGRVFLEQIGEMLIPVHNVAA